MHHQCPMPEVSPVGTTVCVGLGKIVTRGDSWVSRRAALHLLARPALGATVSAVTRRTGVVDLELNASTCKTVF